MRLNPASATISPARAPVQPSRFVTSSRTGPVAACRHQFVKLRGVVPPRRRPGRVGLPKSRHASAICAQCSASASLGMAGPKRISMLVPSRIRDRRHADDRRRAVVLGPQFGPLAARRDNERAVRGEHATGNDAQAVAERATGRQPQELGRDHRSGDAVQARDVLGRPVDAGAVVLDEVAAAWRRRRPALDAGSRCRARCRLTPSEPDGSACPPGRQPSAGSPSTVRKLVQSGRSNFKIGSGIRLAETASGFLKLGNGSVIASLSPRCQPEAMMLAAAPRLDILREPLCGHGAP